MNLGSVPHRVPANDPHHSPGDIREQLRRDHEAALAELDALRHDGDEAACRSRLASLRQAWVIHALAEETVVYRALEGIDSGERADERFVEHELVGDLFTKLGRLKPGSREWNARLAVVRDLIQRHIQTEEADMMMRLGRHFDDKGMLEMGERFRLAHQKLTLLERAKAA